MRKHRAVARTFVIAVTVVVLAGVASSTLAGPALSWWHWSLNISQAECVKRAQRAFATEKFPVKTSESNKVAGSTRDTTAVIKCLRCDGKTMAVIIVTGREAGYFSKAFLGVMKTGR